MGHKVHPLGFRLGVIRDWQSKWYTDTHYVEFLLEDVKLRETIQSKYREAAISLVEIDRQAKDVTITLYTARPGIVIGRGGQRVDEMRLYLEELIGKRVRLNIQEIRQPELDAYLVARAIAEQIERRIAYRRAIKQAIFRTIQAGAKGIKVSCSGRLGNAEIARRQTMHEGRVPLHTLRADIDYGFTEAHTTLGRIGVKVWIYKGEILPEPKVVEAEEEPAELTAEGIEITTAEEVEEKPVEAAAEVSESAEEAIAVEVAEKPAEALVESAEVEPAAEVVEKPVETIAEGAEAAPEAKPEKKPAKPKAPRKTKAEVPAESEEKPAEALVESAEVEPAAEVAEEPVEAVAESAEAVPEAKPKKKPAKPAAGKKTKEAVSAESGKKPAEAKKDTTESTVKEATEAESSGSIEEEDKDAAA